MNSTCSIAPQGTLRFVALVSATVLALALALALALSLDCFDIFSKSTPPPNASPSPVSVSEMRIVSLSPGVTDTISALDRSQRIVGLSDYCVPPPPLQPRAIHPRRVGSALTPDYETIARLKPTLIVTSQVAGEQLRPLSRISKTISLPWLTMREWTSSILELGRLIDRESQAQALVSDLNSTLNVLPKDTAPRVLFSLDYGDSGSNETWFIRKNSIHGAVLRAAGAQNAVSETIRGKPRLSPEELLAIDPDAIIVLRNGEPDRQSERRSLAPYQKWTPLKAVKNGRLAVLSSPNALAISPKLIQLVPQLQTLINQLFPETSSNSLDNPTRGHEPAPKTRGTDQ